MKLRKRYSPLKQSLWQLPMIAFMACLFGLSVNHFRSDSIPVVGDWSVDARFSDSAGESLVISLEDAKKLFEQKQAVFIDARPKDQYDEGHIQKAISLPWQEVDTYFMEVATQFDDQVKIITYCDGESCELSHELALFLKEMGFNNVKVLVNGWSSWQEAGLPVDLVGGEG